MKKFLTTLVVFLLFANFASSQPVWTFVSNTPSPSPVINTISVVNSTTIWAACAAAGGAARVYLTTDGGVNWTLKTGGLPAVDMYGICGLDINNCWVGTVAGSIYMTSNGGANWTLQFSISGSFSDGIKMFNPSYGIYIGDPPAVGQPFQFRYTTNGGTNWTLSPTAPTMAVANEYPVINAWDFTDSAHVLIGSAISTSGTSASRIFRTSTGFPGTFSSTSLTGTGSTSGIYWQTVALINANTGLVGSSAGNICKTTNGGVSFTTMGSPPGVGTSFACMSMSSIKSDGIIRLAIDSGGTSKMYRTSDVGTTWISETIPFQASANIISNMQFLNSTFGYASLGSTSTGIGGLMKYANPSGITNNGSEIPAGFSLSQNYPNPFNPSTTIEFALPKSGNVSLVVYNSIGKEVKTLVSENMAAGTYTVTYDASELTSGMYFYKIVTNGFTDTKKMLLVK
jgi:hypothetical protein